MVTTTTVPTTTSVPTTPTTTADPVTTTAVAAVAVAPDTAQILSPANNMLYSRGSTAAFLGRVQTNAKQVWCTVDWGDGTPPSGPFSATETTPGVYECQAVHLYTRSGIPFIVTFTATAECDGTGPLAADAHRVYVV